MSGADKDLDTKHLNRFKYESVSPSACQEMSDVSKPHG